MLTQLAFTANDYVEQGKALYFEGRFEEAIASFDKAIQMEPDNAKAWFSRGAVLAKLQQFDQAIHAYTNAIASKSDFFLAWFGKARCYAQQGNVDLTLASLKQAISLNSEKCKEAIKVDPSFDGIRDHEQFQKLFVEDANTTSIES